MAIFLHKYIDLEITNAKVAFDILSPVLEMVIVFFGIWLTIRPWLNEFRNKLLPTQQQRAEEALRLMEILYGNELAESQD